MAQAWQDRSFTTPAGLRLHYLDWGGDGPPLLFIHPTGFHAHVWGSYADHFRDRFRCLAIDTRGHGDSDRPGIYNWDAMAGDVEALADGLDLRAITGVGHSGGGTSIAVLAAHRPERMRRAVLIDPIFIFLDLRRAGVSESKLEAASRKRRMVWPSRAAMIESYGSRPPFNAWLPENLANYVNYGVYDQPDGTVTLKMPGEHEAEVFRQAAHGLDPEEILRAIRCPTLVIAGAESEAFPPARAARTVALLAQGELLSVAGEGHFAPFTRTPDVITAIDRFIAADEAGRAK